MENVENSVTKEQLLLKQHNRILGVKPQLAGIFELFCCPKNNGKKHRGLQVYFFPWYFLGDVFRGLEALDLELQKVGTINDFEKNRMKLGHQLKFESQDALDLSTLELVFWGDFRGLTEKTGYISMENLGWFMSGCLYNGLK